MNLQVKQLQAKLEEAQRELVLKECSSSITATEPQRPLDDPFDFDDLDTQGVEEAGPSEEPLPVEEMGDELSQAVKDLAALIAECLEPIQQECMEWEQRVLHSANLCLNFPKGRIWQRLITNRCYPSFCSSMSTSGEWTD